MDRFRYKRGEADARADIAAGNPLLFWQIRGSWGKLFAKLMNERFGVRVQEVGCFTDDKKKCYEKGYNKTIRAHLDDTYGKRQFERLLEEIDDFRKGQYQRWSASQGDS